MLFFGSGQVEKGGSGEARLSRNKFSFSWDGKSKNTTFWNLKILFIPGKNPSKNKCQT